MSLLLFASQLRDLSMNQSICKTKPIQTENLFGEANRVALEACFEAFNFLHSLTETFLGSAHLPPAPLNILL